MTLSKIITKNIFHNIKNYVGLLSAMIFSSGILYLYSHLLFDRNVIANDTRKVIVTFMFIILILFIYLFYRVMYQIYLDSKYKDLGIFFSYGMSKKQIRRMLLGELICINVLAIPIGIAFGAILSKFLSLVLSPYPILSDMDFSPNKTILVFSIALLLFVNTIIIFSAFRRHRKKDVLSMLQQEKCNDKYTYKPKKALLGFTLYMMSFAVIFLGKLLPFQIVALMAVALFFMGINIILKNFLGRYINRKKRNKEIYYKEILSLSDIDYKFLRLKKTLFLMTISICVIQFLSGLAVGFYYGDLGRVKKWSPYDAVVFSDDNMSNSKYFAVDESIAFSAKQTGNGDYDYYIINQNSYQNLTGHTISLNGNNAYYTGIWSKKETSDVNIDGTKLSVLSWDSEIICNNMLNVLIVNDEMYTKYSLDEIYITAYSKLDETQLNLTVIEDGKYTINTRLNNIKSHNDMYFKTLFIVAIIVAVFIFCLNMIVYFKNKTTLAKDREKYKKLKLIGIKQNEIISSLNKEMNLIYTLPLLLSSIGSFMWVMFIAKSAGFFKQVTTGAALIMTTFALLEWIIYAMIKRAYIKDIITYIKKI